MFRHYAINKFVYDTDRNPEFLRRYIDEPEAYVDWYLEHRMSRLIDNESETSTMDLPDDESIAALKNYDIRFLYSSGAHPFILWTLMYPIIEEKLASGDWSIKQQDAEDIPEPRRPAVFYRELIEEFGRPDFRY